MPALQRKLLSVFTQKMEVVGWIFGEFEFNSLWGWRFFSLSLHPDRHWGLPSVLSSGYQGLISKRQSRCGVTLSTHLHPVLKVKKQWSCTSTTKLMLKVGWSGNLYVSLHAQNLSFHLQFKFLWCNLSIFWALFYVLHFFFFLLVFFENS